LLLFELIGKVKVKFTLEQAMKAQRRSRGIALLFKLGDRLGWVINVTLHMGKRPGTHFTGGWAGP